MVEPENSEIADASELLSIPETQEEAANKDPEVETPMDTDDNISEEFGEDRRSLGGS